MTKPPLFVELLGFAGALAAWLLAWRDLALFRRHWIGKPAEDLPRAWSHARRAGLFGLAFVAALATAAVAGVMRGDLGAS